MALLRCVLVIGLAYIHLCLDAQQAPDIHVILGRNQSFFGINSKDSLEYTLTNQYTTLSIGITHVYLQQRYQDIPVHNGILNLNLREDKLLSFGNRWIPDLHLKAPSRVPTITAQAAAARAAAHLGVAFRSANEIRSEQNQTGQVVKVLFAPDNVSREPIVAELMWLQDQKDILLCWNVEIHEVTAENVWHIFIDAHSGNYVKKDNLVMHCAFDSGFGRARHCDHSESAQGQRMPVSLCSVAPLVPDSSYTVFALPTESPNHGSRSVEVRPWTVAGSSNDATTLGWHSTGTINYTITRGNNVHAYEDMDNNNSPGFSPDTSNLRFDYPFDPLLDPEDNMAASITNLFYWNNIVHDVMYQYGFNEVSGNFQVSNLGRGGAGNDDVRAEGLDGGGINNANFFTPADGSRPRMQMYLWSAVPETSPLTIDSPTTIAGSMYAVESSFSSENLLEEIGHTAGDLVLVEDMDTTMHLGCGTISNADSIDGKIAVIDRGECDFTVKVKNVQNAGAIAAIVINDVPGSPFAMGGTDNTIVIPAVMISLNDGNLLKSVMDTSMVHASLDSVGGIIPDGDYDSGIITHEYGHGVSNRLTGGPANVSCLNNDEQMGEGWSDYFAMMLTTDWSDASATDLRGLGTYAIGQSTDGTGIRTYPYTTDTLENPFTYADIADAPLNNGNPSPHFIGSVWCTMLWDMTWNIIEIEGTDPDIYHGTGGNNIALQLVIDALKLQPCRPGFVDGRNAILLADQIRYGGQYSCAIWEAFARRGLGVDASQGGTDNHEDGMESFNIPTGVFLESTAGTYIAGEGQEVTFTVKATCGCEGKSNLEITDVLSEDLIYIPGSGGTLDGNAVVFTADTLEPRDSLVFSYRAFVRPCSATTPDTLSQDSAEGPDQFQTMKLAGTGTRQWVKSTAQFVSPPNSWYARNYSSLSDYVLAMINPVSTGGIVEIAFDHRYETEANYDGGVVEYSLNNGMTWLDAGPFFIENGYPAQINTANTNSPIAGRKAFTGDSDVQFDTIGFVRSSVLLFLADSQSLRVRFRFACDGGVGGSGINGWYVDNIRISQRSGIINQTYVTADSLLQDSLRYGLMTSIYEGNVVYVDASASGEASGVSWNDAMYHLPLALEIAGCRDADSVFVAEGTYLPNLTNDRALSFFIPDSTWVFGGFPEGGDIFAMRDPATHITVFSGDLGIQNDISHNTYHVVKIDSAQQGVILDGLTLSHGNANGLGEESRGAAISCAGELTLKNVTIGLNHGVADGQIIYIRNAVAHLLLEDCTIYSTDDSLIKLLNTELGQVTVSGNTLFLKE